MRKHKKIIQYAISSLFRRKYKNLSIMVVFSFIIAALSSLLFLADSLKNEALNLLVDAPELIVQKTTGGRHDLIPVHYMESIENIPGVGRVIPRYWGYYYDALTKGNYTIIGAGQDINGLKLLDGRMPEGFGECAIGQGVSQVRFMGIDGELYLTDHDGRRLELRITGVFQAESDILTHDLILLKKEDAMGLLGISEGKATDLVVQVYNESEVPTVARKISRMFPDTRPIMRSEILRTYEALFSWRSGVSLTLFLGALMAFCILVWDKATGLSADERKEIGILKAIGWETGDILEMKFWEGMVISLTSFLAGIALAYAHVFFLGAPLLAPMLKGWSVLFPDFNLVPYIDLYQIFALLFLTVLPYTATTIIPSWKSAITEPDAVMRG
jgi:hypothetical protein